jgi:hypothetical protein
MSALAIIYYKYISKASTTYSKLTIAADVAKEFATTHKGSKDAGKTMLVKTYNKLASHREADVRNLVISPIP